MLIPSIDLVDGQAVQLIGGEKLAIEAGDPRPWARRFGRVGTVAVVDLDAALGRGANEAVIRELLELAPCRVGGGIRSLEQARSWLDAGAEQIVVGTRAEAQFLDQLPRERVVVALDARRGVVATEGWTRTTGACVTERLGELQEHCAGFLVTCIENEGRLRGVDFDFVRQLKQAAGERPLTFAGGVATAAEIAQLEAMGVDAQVGMALYRGDLDLAAAWTAGLRETPDRLWPTVVCDEQGVALGFVYSSTRSIRAALEEGIGVYESRRRGLWRKGETSGNVQELIRIEADCDRDALRFFVRQAGTGFCHREQSSCWGPARGLKKLEQTLARRLRVREAGSYTNRLFDDPELLGDKLVEEARELATAEGPDEVVHEATDVLFFASVKLAQSGLSWAAVERELDRRSRRVQRRGGDSKCREARHEDA